MGKKASLAVLKKRANDAQNAFMRACREAFCKGAKVKVPDHFATRNPGCLYDGVVEFSTRKDAVWVAFTRPGNHKHAGSYTFNELIRHNPKL